MKFSKNSGILGVALGAGFLATVSLLPQARGELVLENGTADSTGARVDDRSTMKQALGASEKAQVTVQAQGVQTAPAQQIVVQTQPAAPAVVAPVVVAPAAAAGDSTEVQNLSKTELMRRQRMREEVKNEDILQERLEELRLRDEQRRSKELLAADAPSGLADAPVAVTAPVQNQVVVSPVTENAGAVPAQPVGVVPVAVPATAQMGMSTVSAEAAFDASDRNKTQISVSPRFGMANMDSNAGVSVQSRFSTGVTLSAETSENLAFEIGYNYNEYGIVMPLSNVMMSYYAGNPMFNQSGQTQVLKDNVFDAGVKFQLLGRDSKIHPFIGAGGGYSTGYLNYNQQLLASMPPGAALQFGNFQNYNVTRFLGYIEAGIDVKLSKALSAGMLFKYYRTLSANEPNQLNPYSSYLGYGYSGYSYGGYGSPYGVNGGTSPDAQVAGASLANSNFYSLTGSLTLAF